MISLCISTTFIKGKNIWLLEVGDGDDDQQVESCSEQRDAGQQNVNKQIFRVRKLWPRAGVVEL